MAWDTVEDMVEVNGDGSIVILNKNKKEGESFSPLFVL